MFGFTLNGKHSYNDFGIIIGKFNIPILGDLKEYRDNIPGIQGTVLLQQDDLDDRTIEFSECYLMYDPSKDVGDAYVALQKKARAIAAWLNPRNGPQYITMDNDLGISYYGVLSGKVDTSVIGSARSFKLTFRCDPILYSSHPASDYNSGPVDGLPFDSGAEYGQPTTSPTVLNSGSFNLWNGGTAPAYPKLTITPVTAGQSFSNLTITNTTTGESLTWSGTCSTSLVIDCKYMVAYTTSGSSEVNQFSSLSGDFFSLSPGETNAFSITVTGNIQLDFDYRFPFY